MSLILVFDAIIAFAADCYEVDGCLRAPMTGTLGYGLDALKQVAYFAVFPLGMVFGRRDFRKAFAKRLPRRIARITFAAIPVILFPLKYLLAIKFF